MTKDATKGDIDLLCINTMRTLAMDAVQAANSGHPGTPMSMAPVGYTLWQQFLRYAPADPHWPNRDRFVLSAGHACMLLYSLIHLSGVRTVDKDGKVQKEPSIPIEEIKRFRQLHSKCAGHPECHLATGIETTTGPLGQGYANSVGMAIAGRWFAATYNRPGFNLFDFNVYALGGDGCMMEGISSEAASLAGHLKLSNLCWIYDNNHITIEGETSLAFSEDVGARFKAYGWNVIHVTDANDLSALAAAFKKFSEGSDRPLLIIVDSHIAWGAPTKHDTAAAHGEPLGEEEVKNTKKFYGWPEDAKFLVPDGVREHFQAGIGARGASLSASWDTKFKEYKAKHPDLARQLEMMWSGTLPEGWDKDLPSFPSDPKGVASRESSGKVLNLLAERIPWLLGGAADLAPSTKTLLKFKGVVAFEAGEFAGRNFHFGIREHTMGGIINGMALSKLRPYGSSFLVFSDYGRPSIRLGALMGLPVIYVYTHDSICLGEDGPTHQPIEHLPSLRAIPGLVVVRPADANEVTESWKLVLSLRHEPALLVLTRQAIPTLDRSRYGSAAGVCKGGYILADADGGKPDVLILASGSEIHTAVEAYESLKKQGVRARVVSLPSWEIFARQSQEYRDQVLPPAVRARVAIETASPFGWERYVGEQGTVIGMRTFGASAPYKELLKEFGFTTEAVVAAALKQIDRVRKC